VKRRPTIADVARTAGVSVATVDRVLNRRHPVREETARRVLAAGEAIGFHAIGLLRQRALPDAPPFTFGFVLQKEGHDFYRGLAAALGEAARTAPGVRGRAVTAFAPDLTPGAVAETLAEVGGRADAVAVVAVDHPSVTAAIEGLKARGVPVFALLSGLTAPAPSGYVGLDNRKAGRMAAWAIARTARAAGEVGLIVGSHRYLGHEMREIGFRSYFREHAPDFRLLDTLTNLEEPRIAHEATLDLLKRHPGLVGLCVAGGGMEGVIAALREENRQGTLSVVVNELTPITRQALIDDVITLAIATPIAAVAERTVDAMIRGARRPLPETIGQVLLPFELYTSENL